MKIALAQLNYHIGNFEQNATKIIASIEQAKQRQADLIVFAELSLCGYPPRDFLVFKDFIGQCEEKLHEIAKHAIGIGVIVGSPITNPAQKGKSLLNSAIFMQEGKIVSTHHKALLPTYDVFDENRYFEPGKEFSVIELKGKKIAITICEDIWDVGDAALYETHPMEFLSEQGAELIVNISASPFHYNQREERGKVHRRNVEKFGIPLIFVNHVGAQTELIFDGGSRALNCKAKPLVKLPYFEEGIEVVCLVDLQDEQQAPKESTPPKKTESIYSALTLGISDYFRKLGFQKAILGLSGGIDSAVTLALACEALGAENVLSVNLPSEFSSKGSIEDSLQLTKQLGSPLIEIPIASTYNEMMQSLKDHFNDLPFDIAEENLQARIRAVYVMALSNKHDYILLNTSNKSELAVGYGTLYGDMCGGLSVLGDVYKTQVYELAEYINRNREIIPKAILEKPPSAELRPDQTDAQTLPPYEELDQILHHYIEQELSPKAITEQGFEESLVMRILKLVNTSEYKRHQAPPILRISPKAFGMGRRMPIVGKYLA